MPRRDRVPGEGIKEGEVDERRRDSALGIKINGNTEWLSEILSGNPSGTCCEK